jgi:DNA replication licensing factor MCM4
MRSLGNTSKTITATPRQLESMIRIAEALAKMRLSHTVDKRDVDDAVKLIRHALQ